MESSLSPSVMKDNNDNDGGVGMATTAPGELDWRYYSYEDIVSDPIPLEHEKTAAAAAAEVPEAWDDLVNKKMEEVSQIEDSVSDSETSVSSDGSRSRRPGTPVGRVRRRKTPPRVHFKQSMEDIFHKHKTSKPDNAAGILKNNSRNGPEHSLELPSSAASTSTATEGFREKSKTMSTESTLTLEMDDDDSNDAISQFEKYISEKVVRFAKRKDSRIKFLWSNLDVENKAQWEKERGRRRGHEKRSWSYDSAFIKESSPPPQQHHHKGEIHLPLIKHSSSSNQKSIRNFEKRNVTRTISKLSDLESLFIKSKSLTPDSMSEGWSGEVVDQVDQDDPLATSLEGHPQMDKRGSRPDPIGAIATHHGKRLKRAIRKVQRLLAANNGGKLKKSIRTLINKDEVNENELSSETIPLERFRHAGRLIILLLRAVGIRPEKTEDYDYNFLSWTILYDELGISRTPYDPSGLMFDPQQFKASKESFLSHDIRDILLKKTSERTDAQIQQVIRFLSQVVPSFGEYPMRIQRSTLKCCTLERFEAGRVIIRQGHKAENFYFIISGTAVVTVMESGANHVHTVNSLTSGNSFGELAFLNMSQRTATVTCRENMELLCIERENFIEIFMRRIKGQEPEHMTFLRNVDLLNGWPVENLPLDNLKICAFTYVRRGVILSPDSSKSDWLFVVVSGTCKVLKAILDPDVSKERIIPHRQLFKLPTFDLRKKIAPQLKTDEENRHGLFLTHLEDSKKKKSNLKHVPYRQPSAIDMIVNRSKEEVRLSQEDHLNRLESIYRARHVLPSINTKNDKDIRKENISPNESSNVANGETEQGNDVVVVVKVDEKRKRSQHQQQVQSSHHLRARRPVPIKPATPSQFLRETTQNFGIQRSAESAAAAAAKRLVVTSPGASTVHSWNAEPQVKKVFIEVARLEPGDVFGLEQLVMSDREEVTSTSLVSDGAEVIIIDKKFFRKHLTEETAKCIRKMIRPLPSESVLQQNFVDQKYWDAYKSKTLEKHANEYLKSKTNVAFRA